jgi:carbamoyltransferase
MDLARSVQEVTELAMLRMARHVRKETGERNLVLAGGVALNCVGNGKILEAGIFDNIWIQPAAGDAGGALGAALYAWHQGEGKPRHPDGERDSQKGTYLGPSFSNQNIRRFLDEHGYKYTYLEDDELLPRVAGLMADENVVGWFNGRMEFGPRALGARSIIGDARSPRMQSVMNLKIKYRESFRPFAPSCLREDAAELFELDRESPYMMLVAPVRQKYRTAAADEEEGLFGIDKLNVPRGVVPAVTHVDYSARIQTVDPRDHPRYHRLIEEVKKRTGYGVVINTSFNVRGEPIVCTPEDAYLCFMRTGMDALVLEDMVLLKAEQPPLVDDAEWRAQHELD